MKRLRQRSGFMLLEVLIALVIVAIGMCWLIETLRQCLSAARSIQQYSISQSLLANKAYEFRVERPQDFLYQDGKFDDYPGFTWERRFDRSDVDDLWEQTITVFWQEKGRRVSESIHEYRYLPDKQQ